LDREVPLEHPDYPDFGKLGLKWGAVPSITSESQHSSAQEEGVSLTVLAYF